MTDDALQHLASTLESRGFSIAVAESLTCGMLANTLGAAEGASGWLRGGVVAYADEVKFEVLGVTPGPVITADCAREMAEGVVKLLRADLGLAVTGVGGPGPAEGKPAGTVFMAATLSGMTVVREFHLEGGPPKVLRMTTDAALRLALEVLA